MAVATLPDSPHQDSPSEASLSPNVLRRAARAMKELARRQAEALRIYQPLPKQLIFHQSEADIRLCIGSNRSGKTNAAAAEVAWRLMGEHPFQKVPAVPRIYAVGWDHEHIKQVMWQKLARPGSFNMIRDEKSNEWRPVIPDQEYDKAYREKWREAPPLIPPRWIKWDKIAWHSKKDDMPKSVPCVNDAELFLYSSKGAPQQGNEIDFWWCDEELENQSWVAELNRGLVKRSGKGLYSATPLAASDSLYRMWRMSQDPEQDSGIDGFHFLIDDNIYISQKQKDTFRKQLLSEQDVKVRYNGEFALGGMSVYPEYKKDTHVIKSFDPPQEWNRYMVVDPGVQVCAVLFIALPDPDSDWFGTVHVYNEAYIRRCSAKTFGETVANEMGRYKRGGFIGFLIDHRMGRQTQINGRTVEIQYSDALSENDVYSAVTGTGFDWGCDDIAARENSLRRWLFPNPDTGKPTVIIHDKCRYLDWEIPEQFYEKNKTTGVISDKRRDANNHAVTCLEMFAHYSPDWIEPRPPDVPESAAYRKAMQLKRGKRSSGHISLAPLS